MHRQRSSLTDGPRCREYTAKSGASSQASHGWFLEGDKQCKRGGATMTANEFIYLTRAWLLSEHGIFPRTAARVFAEVTGASRCALPTYDCISVETTYSAGSD